MMTGFLIGYVCGVVGGLIALALYGVLKSAQKPVPRLEDPDIDPDLVVCPLCGKHRLPESIHPGNGMCTVCNLDIREQDRRGDHQPHEGSADSPGEAW
jgi:hypothetical protein